MSRWRVAGALWRPKGFLAGLWGQGNLPIAFGEVQHGETGLPQAFDKVFHSGQRITVKLRLHSAYGNHYTVSGARLA